MSTHKERWVWFGSRSIGPYYIRRVHNGWRVSFNGEYLRVLPSLSIARWWVRSLLS